MWATVNQHPPVHHEGWMINGLETAFCCVPVPYGCQPWWLAQLLFFTTYLLTTHRQFVSRQEGKLILTYV
jgi:hypothetical protein